MKEFFLWWVGIEAVGVAAFPLAYAFFRRLPDRGFAFSKVVGLLLLGYGLWAGAVVGLFPNSRGSVILLLLVIGALSAAAAGRYRAELAGFLRSGWRYIAFVEALFFAVLVSGVFVRSFAPEIVWGEKPFELAFLNSVSRSDFFPPPDPWLAGESISYYYFGYVMVSALSKLVALGTNVTFYLALSLMAALAAVTAFGLVYNLIVASRRDEGAPGPALIPRAVVFGLAGAALMLIVSNLAGVFELMARHGVGSRGFYGLVGIAGLDGPYDCAATPGDCAEWYPTRFWWWWKATRMGSPFDIQEFPFFSFQFGDLHPHVLVMPFLITLLAVAFQKVLGARSEGQAGESGPADRLDALWVLRHPGRFVLLALLLGGIAFIDAWAIPLAVLMLLASAGLANWLRTGGRPGRVLVDTVGFAVPVLAAMFVFYLPFYLHLDADARGLTINQTALTAVGPPQDSEATRPLHFLLFWGPLLWVGLSFVAVYMRGQWREMAKPSLLSLAVLVWAAPVVLWALIIVGRDGPGALADELSERGANLITVLMIATAVTAVVLAFLHQLRKPPGAQDRGRLFAFYLAGFALLMLVGAELYYVRDLLGWRGNTVFRFWHQSWIILSVVGGFGLYRLTQGWRLPQIGQWPLSWRHLAGLGVAAGITYSVLVAAGPWDGLPDEWWSATAGILAVGASMVAYAIATVLRGAPRAVAWRRLSWLGVTVVVLGAALVYPVTVTFERTGGFRNPQSLNGLVHVQRSDPAEYEAIAWLNRNVEGTPVILEAAVPFADRFEDIGGYARVSSRTGLPTVIGWPGHEVQWRGYPDSGDPETPFTARPEEVAIIYTTADVEEAESLLDKYDVEYVYVGRLERQKYGDGGLDKFPEFMIPVFENEEVTIYRMPEEVASDVQAHQ